MRNGGASDCNSNRSQYESRAPKLVSSHALYAEREGSQEGRFTASIVFFLDETGGDNSGFNRLYFDRNADGRFEADECAGLVANPPYDATAAFEPFDIRLSPSEPTRRFAARLRQPGSGVPENLMVGAASPTCPGPSSR